MKPQRPWPRWFALTTMVSSSLLLLVGIVNAVLNTANIGSWLLLVVVMPITLRRAVWSLRNQDER
ncbi:hypothetical protein DEJ16_13015 [Curtobacterium sp. MCJR17_055]|uniref:hypothetical protein n=1 Tax=unclassified Curtobacterium TaxID=257496 RepID=UPI000D8473B6|nr:MULTISPECIES: hypothetical protein [unclassified Curtobacterium]PYY34154.1 hypothetical protein DEI87_10440 [Curtobacterium sp. MCBD17_029]PYY54005.1 hypothetical protein DEJ16_13015 [Curtobacterium sp. MCJR17_055]PYY59108.1 hypothetical protein DEJ26_08800 [Curtobacterium sp. MCPF17_015]WIB34762.1 hypothetical protein DEJ15_09145 [Curtobacterium sp. MCJR17_043]